MRSPQSTINKLTERKDNMSSSVIRQTTTVPAENMPKGLAAANIPNRVAEEDGHSVKSV